MSFDFYLIGRKDDGPEVEIRVDLHRLVPTGRLSFVQNEIDAFKEIDRRSEVEHPKVELDSSSNAKIYKHSSNFVQKMLESTQCTVIVFPRETKWRENLEKRLQKKNVTNEFVHRHMFDMVSQTFFK